MFGRRRGLRRFPLWLRLPVGMIFFFGGALVLLVELGLVGDQHDVVRENQFAGAVTGFVFAAVGVWLALGVLTGVDDFGKRPVEMTLRTRLLLDALGYAFGFGFAAMLGLIGVRADWGDANIFPRVVFCAFAALVGGLTLYALGRAVMRATRGLPYDDGHRHEASGE